MSTKAEMTPDNMRAQLRIINAELVRVDDQITAYTGLLRSLEILLRHAQEKPGPTVTWVELEAVTTPEDAP